MKVGDIVRRKDKPDEPARIIGESANGRGWRIESLFLHFQNNRAFRGRLSISKKDVRWEKIEAS